MISTTRNLNQILPSTKKFLCRSSHTLDPKSINWGQLGFGYVPTNCSLILEHQDGVWSKTFKQSEPYIKIHLLSNVLHYGQALFEGLKAFHTKDKKVVIFNPIENAQRMKNGAKRLGMPDIDTDVFIKAMENIVKLNLDFVPPYGTGGSLYLRPFYFGHGAKLGLGKAPEYCFGVISSPVGLYYPTGLKAVDAMVVERYDRAAPLGVGNVKVAGNYAADIVPAAESAAMGYPISLYLDALHHKYVEEFSTSNFIAISKDKKKYVTPLSDSVLPSITNKMLRKIAEKKGLKIEQRPIEFEEIANGEFSEVAACGTAVIVTPIKSITKGKLKVKLNEKLDVLEGLYNDIRALQTGEKPDEFGWRHYVCDK